MSQQAIAVLAPAVVTLVCLPLAISAARANKWLLILTTVVTLFIALPPVQSVFHWGDRPLGNTYLLPVFPVAYVLFGQFDRPSLSFMFAGSFLTLLIGDLAAMTKLAIVDGLGVDAYGFIGGAGLMDGLLIMPIAGTALAAFVSHQLKSGKRIRLLFGRDAYLRSRHPD